MASKPNVKANYEEVSFKSEGLDARALITKTDKKGIIQFASKAYRDMTKYSKDELIGHSHSIVRHPGMPEEAFKEMWETIQAGHHWEGVIRNLRGDGKHYWVVVQIDPIDEEGNLVYDQPEKIAGFIAVRREPKKEEIKEAEERYREIRIKELSSKSNLKDWEKETLENLKSGK